MSEVCPCFCVCGSDVSAPVSIGEPGEMVGKIVKGDPLREFDGYVNKEATSKKITHSVFKKGDSVFLTGILL